MDIPSQLNDALIAAKPFLPLAALAIIGIFAYAAALGGGPLAVVDKHQCKASADIARRGSVFGAAADQNVVYTPEEASGNDKSDELATASDTRYAIVKYMSNALDYALIFAVFSYCNEHYTGDKFDYVAAGKIYLISYATLVMVDLFKGIIFVDVVPKAKTDHLRCLAKEFVKLFSPNGLVEITKFILKLAKGEGTIYHFSDKGAQRRGILYHIFYMVKIGIITAGGAFVSLAYMDMAKFEPILGTAFEVKLSGNFSILVPNLVSSYLLFLFIDIMKDAVCMNILHQIMHRRWYDLHYVHHLPMKEVSMVNFTFFDVADAVLENLIGPIFILLIKFLMDPTKTPTIDMSSIMFMTFCDFNTHSLCPYTVNFYFPPFDNMLSPVVSHNLHHALNTGHYTIFPLHQLKGVYQYDNRSKTNIDGSLEHDWKAYNRVFKTNFPEGR